MVRTTGVCWVKFNSCLGEEWKETSKNRQKKLNVELALESQQVPDSYYKNLRNKKKRDE